MTETSRHIYTLIYPFTEPATNHCSENGLNHMRVMEYPDVHKISPFSVLHHTHNSNSYATEWWLIATKLHVSIRVKSDTRELGYGPANRIWTCEGITHWILRELQQSIGYQSYGSQTCPINQNPVMVISILLYGCTTWTLTKHIEKRLDSNVRYEYFETIKWCANKWALIIFTNPSTRAGYDTRSIFKGS